ncbi:MAG: hypothetical protein CMM07_04300 [Rhodopirellula sp.]|nr:hypothetical protein [Rhodopirellula sp.]
MAFSKIQEIYYPVRELNVECLIGIFDEVYNTASITRGWAKTTSRKLVQERKLHEMHFME